MWWVLPEPEEPGRRAAGELPPELHDQTLSETNKINLDTPFRLFIRLVGDDVKIVRLGRHLGVTVALWVLLGLVTVQPAWAHGGNASTEGYLIVQQAVGYLANDAGAGGTAKALMKVDEALATPDQEGVAVPQVQLAKTALKAGNVADGRKLLQASITTALATLKPATGEGTGTTIVTDPWVGRAHLSGGDWALLTLSLLIAFAGMALAFFLRPRDSLRGLLEGLSPRANAKGTPRSPLEERHNDGH